MRRFAPLFLVNANTRESFDENEIESFLTASLTQSRELFPSVEIVDNDFVVHLAQRAVDANQQSILKSLHIPDLYIACGCCHQTASAIEIYEKSYLPSAWMALHRMKNLSSPEADLRQIIREKILVGQSGAPPKIYDYAGRGPLAAWSRTVAVRTALTLHSKEKIVKNSQPLENELLDASQFDLATLKTEYVEAFRQAFREAMLELSAKERNLLKLSVLDNLTTEEIGTLFQAHKSTVSRWIADVREKLHRLTRKHLSKKLSLKDAREFESVLGLVRSQLYVSLQGFFETKPSVLK